MIGLGRDVRLEANEGSSLRHEGACRRCGRSSLKALCRTCSKNPDAPLVRAPEPARAPSALADAARVIQVDQEEKPVAQKTELEPRACALESCSVTFTPGRRTQRFHTPECKRAFFHAEAKASREKDSKPVTEKAKKTAPRAATPDRDVKPANPIAVMCETPRAIEILLALAELDRETRRDVLTWAHTRWGS